MCLKIYYVPLRVLDVTRHSLSGLETRPCNVRGNAFLAVKGCLKFFGAVFRGVFAWEKSMLSALSCLVVVAPDWGHYILGVVDGVFLHG